MSQQRRILFVDDEPQILDGLRHRLRRFRTRWDLCFADGGEHALEQLAKGPFDVIVTDLRMARMDGAALLGEVKARFPSVVRVVLSGESEVDLSRRAALVAHQFLAKPCEPDALERVVERALALKDLVNDEPVRRIVGQVDALPAMPATYARVRALVADDRRSSADVARVIKGDPALSAKLLQLVNSAFFALPHAVTRVEDAVVRLGLERTESIVLASECFNLASTGAVRLQVEALQHHSIATAHVAERLPLSAHREESFIAGLLHDVGKLLLAVHVPRHLRLADEEAARAGIPSHVAERQLFGVTHAEVGAYLLGLWGLPQFLVEAVANHHEPMRVPDPCRGALAAVHVANAIDHARSGDELALPDPAYLQALGAGDADWQHWLREHAGDKESP